MMDDSSLAALLVGTLLLIWYTTVVPVGLAFWGHFACWGGLGFLAGKNVSNGSALVGILGAAGGLYLGAAAGLAGVLHPAEKDRMVRPEVAPVGLPVPTPGAPSEPPSPPAEGMKWVLYDTHGMGAAWVQVPADG